MGLIDSCVAVDNRCIILSSIVGARFVIRDDRFVMDDCLVMDNRVVMDKSLLVNNRRVVRVDNLLMVCSCMDCRFVISSSVNNRLVIRCSVDNGLMVHSSLNNRVVMDNLSIVDVGGFTEGWADLAWGSMVVSALHNHVVLLGSCHCEVQWLMLQVLVVVSVVLVTVDVLRGHVVVTWVLVVVRVRLIRMV